MEQFGLSRFPSLTCSESAEQGKPASFTALPGDSDRLLLQLCVETLLLQPSWSCYAPVTLGRASQNGVKWRGNASSSPPRWLRATLYTNFFSLGRFWILIPHHPPTAFGSALHCRDLGKLPHLCDSGDMSCAVFTGLPALLSCFGNPLLSCRY